MFIVACCNIEKINKIEVKIYLVDYACYLYNSLNDHQWFIVEPMDKENLFASEHKCFVHFYVVNSRKYIRVWKT